MTDLSQLSDEQLLMAANTPISSAILGQESGGNPNIKNSVDNAIGQGQITPDTWVQYAKPGENINDSKDNLAVHHRIINDLSQKFNGDPARIAVGYFSGPGNVAPLDSPTPYIKDAKDGNGKTVSSYVADIYGRLPKPPAENPLTNMSNEELQKIANPRSAPDTFSTISDNALQGATFGIGNRAAAGLAALVASGINGKPIDENYHLARLTETQKLADEAAQNPKTAIFANIAGALGTGGLGADTAAGSAIANSLRTGSLPARIAKGALAGATSGAAYGAGTAGYDQNLQGAKQGAVSGALVGGAIPAAGALVRDVYQTGKNAIAGALADSPEVVQDAAAGLKSAAGGLYDQMRQVGATFKPSAIQGFLIPDIEKNVGKNNFIPALNPKTTAIIDDLKAKAATGDLGLDQLDQYRRLLGRIGGSEDGVSAGAAKQAIDNFVNTANSSHLSNGSMKAVSLLNQGRKQYAQASKFETVADILAKADGDANKIKSGLKRFLVNNNNKPIGWSAPEISALKNAASTGVTEALLKMGGKFGIDLGSSLNVGNTIGPIIGYGVGGGVAPIAGTAARQAQKWAAQGGAQNLLNILEGSAKAPLSGNLVSPLAALAGKNAATSISSSQKSPMRIGLKRVGARP